METPLIPEISLTDVSPEVRSFIYQTISEFTPFATPDTEVQVLEKSPLELLQNEDAPELSRAQLKRMHRIEISLSDSGSTISAEGMDRDIYGAITKAKVKLMEILTQIQDDVISNSDRSNQIRQALAAGGTIH